MDIQEYASIADLRNQALDAFGKNRQDIDRIANGAINTNDARELGLIMMMANFVMAELLGRDAEAASQ